MHIEIIQVQAPQRKMNAAGKPYDVLEVAYKDDTGRVQGKKLMSFQNPEVYKFISTAKTGDKFDVTSEKINNFWNWTKIGPITEGIEDSGTLLDTRTSYTSKPAATLYKGSTYETPEERLVKQTKISRQAVLNTAVAFAGVSGKKTVTQDEIIDFARVFEQWVNRDASAVGGDVADMKSDIPY